MSLLDQIADAARPVLRVSGGCHNCPRKRVDYVPATLRDGQIIWLGEAPGAEEAKQGEGFVGQSGQFMRRLATEAKVPEPWSFSNAIHCRPPDNKTPEPREIECCLSQFVLDEIRGYPIVVLVGGVPLRALFPKADQSHFVGNVAYHPDFPGQKFYAIYHPAYILRRRDLEPLFKKQIERLGRIARGEPPPTWKILRGKDAADALPEVLAKPLISLDLETDRLESWDPGATIKSLCLTADAQTVVFFHKDDPALVWALDQIKAFLEDPGKSIVGSNIAFDVEWLERDLEFTARCLGIHDTSIIWYEAGQYKYPSLKQLVSERLDGYRYLIQNPHLERDPERLMMYNAEDVVHPIHLFVRGILEMRGQTKDLVTRVLGPATLIYRKAQAHGFYVRQDYRRLKIDEYREKRREAVLAWKEEDPEFVPSDYESGKGLKHYLFTVKKLPVISMTASEQEASVDAAAIKQWIHDGAAYLKHLLKIREIDKLLSTYLKAYDKHVGFDSRIHANFWLTSTDTSRPSSSDPNLFNIPRAAEIRDMFGVPPGSAMIESDLSQIEFRIMVCRAKDETGIAGYLRGDDAHTMTARSITGKEKPSKEDRSLAKPINFGCLYGGSWEMVQAYAANEYGVYWSDSQTQDFHRGFFNTYKALPPFHEDCRRRLVENRGWFESVTGHVHHYPDWDSQNSGWRDHAFRQAINAEAQGPAANICLYIAVLARRLLDARKFERVMFVNSVYDSIMTEVPNPKWVPDVIATIDEATLMAWQWVKHWFIVPLIIDHKVGESWGSLEEIKR